MISSVADTISTSHSHADGKYSTKIRSGDNRQPSPRTPMSTSPNRSSLDGSSSSTEPHVNSSAKADRELTYNQQNTAG